MRSKVIHSAHGKRTLVAILDTGDEVMECLTRLADDENLSAAQISAIGAFQRAVITYFDWETKDYERIPVDEQVEVASLLGDIGRDEAGKPKLHIHLVLGKRDGSALAGHLAEAIVRPTLEVVITESPDHLVRRPDAESGLALIRL